MGLPAEVDHVQCEDLRATSWTKLPGGLALDERSWYESFYISPAIKKVFHVVMKPDMVILKNATYIGYLKVFRMFGHVSIPYLLLHHTLISTTSVGFNFFF